MFGPSEAPADQPGAGAGPFGERLAQLQTLHELRAAGALTDEEFAVQKARLLA